MVAIRIDENRLRRVRSRSTQPVFQNANSGAITGAFGFFDRPPRGADLAAGLNRVSDDLSGIALQMAEEDNETRAKEADARIAQRVRSILYGDPGGSGGFYGTKSAATLELAGGTETALRGVLDNELEAAGSNRRLRSLIAAQGQRRLNTALDRMYSYTADQRIVHQEQASLGREAQAFTDIAADYNDATNVADSLKIVSAEALDRAEAQGMGPDAATQLVRQRTSMAVKAATDAALANGDAIRASQIFAQYADLLDSTTRIAISDAVTVGQLDTAAQSLAEEAIARHGATPAALEYIRNVSEGRAESEALAVVRRQIEDFRSAFRFENTRADSELKAETVHAEKTAMTAIEAVIEEQGENADPSVIRERLVELASSPIERRVWERALNDYLRNKTGDQSIEETAEDKERTDEALTLMVSTRGMEPEERRNAIIDQTEDDLRLQQEALELLNTELSRASRRLDASERRDDIETRNRGLGLLDATEGLDREERVKEIRRRTRGDLRLRRLTLQLLTEEEERESGAASREARVEERARQQELLARERDAMDLVAETDGLEGRQERIDFIIQRAGDDLELRQEALSQLDQVLSRESATATFLNSSASQARAEVNFEIKEEERRRTEAFRSASRTIFAAVNETRQEGAGPITEQELRIRFSDEMGLLSENPTAMQSLQRSIEARAEGRIFAEVTNQELYLEVLERSKTDLANTNLDELKRDLTRDDFEVVRRAVQRARDSLEAQQERREASYAPARAGMEAIRRMAVGKPRLAGSDGKYNTPAYRLAERMMIEWVETNLEAGNDVPLSRINEKAAELTMPIAADLSFFSNDFEGFGAQVSALTPEQRAVLEVDYEDIPPHILQRIQGYANADQYKGRLDFSKFDEDTLEKLAGAEAARDNDRIRTILENLARSGRARP